ncbi:hypothetical protein [Candidatus Palauibacter sp.]|uniref:hypothetical protein n=1 Tax=Candidatus Palauibacter sp. TaxID=3101350 RepID=UPI003B523326
MRLVEELRLGRVDGSGPDVFANIDDLAVDAGGRIYVADVGWREVRLFDRDGRFVRRLAPEGDGPGERRYWPAAVSTRVTWDALRDRLWIDDGLNLLVLDSLGAEYARETRAPGFLPGNREPMGTVFRVDVRGRLYQVLQGPSGGSDSTYAYLARGTADSEFTFVSERMLRIEARAVIRGPPRTRRTRGATHTYTIDSHEPPQTAWAVSPAGELWGTGINEPRLWALSFTGDTLRTMSLAGAVGSKRMELDISPEGWFWIRREPGSDARSTWDLLDNCGAYRGSASVPHNVSLTEVGSGGRIHVVASDALGVEYVLRLRLEANVEARPC